jgi:hypothetical protein
MNEDSDAQLHVEFEALARRAGLVIPEERRQAFFVAFKDFRRMLERLHRPREADVETASVFSVDAVRRGAS